MAMLLADIEGVKILDPTRNPFNTKMSRFKGTMPEFVSEAVHQSQHLLRPKDYQMVKSASLVVAHLGIIDPGKPLIGTVVELSWAHDIFYLPVIGITGGQTNAYTDHPWINECLSAKVATEEEAAALIRNLFTYSQSPY